jgi:hypothetical protein
MISFVSLFDGIMKIMYCLYLCMNSADYKTRTEIMILIYNRGLSSIYQWYGK